MLPPWLIRSTDSTRRWSLPNPAIEDIAKGMLAADEEHRLFVCGELVLKVDLRSVSSRIRMPRAMKYTVSAMPTIISIKRTRYRKGRSRGFHSSPITGRPSRVT